MTIGITPPLSLGDLIKENPVNPEIDGYVIWKVIDFKDYTSYIFECVTDTLAMDGYENHKSMVGTTMKFSHEDYRVFRRQNIMEPYKPQHFEEELFNI